MTSWILSGKQQSRGSVVAINQTRSQVEEISKDKKYYLQMISYKVYILIREFYQVTNV